MLNDNCTKPDGMLPPEPLKSLQGVGYTRSNEGVGILRDGPGYYKDEEGSIQLTSHCGTRSHSKMKGCHSSSRDVRYYDRCEDVDHQGEWDVRPDESWSDPAIRWSQNRHDGITPASQPLRLHSRHTKRSVPSSRRRPPSRGPSRVNNSLPPRANSAPADYYSGYTNNSKTSIFSAPAMLGRQDSNSTAPSMPLRMPTMHSTSLQQQSRRSPPSRPIRAPSVHSRAYCDDGVQEEESLCPSFYDLSVVDRHEEFQEPYYHQTAKRGGSKQQTSPSSAVAKVETNLLEVAPGIRLPLRRSAETLEAIRNDFYVPAVCVGCGVDLFCIEDAEFYICPSCKTIGPLDAALAIDNDQEKLHHGVGIGFTAATLWQAQSDLLRAGRRPRHYSID